MKHEVVTAIGHTPAESSQGVPPRQIGRYRVEKLLGQGGFGLVYLAHDDQLQRLVAVKVPHPHRISAPADAEAYLTEARMVAGLDHPNIIPVYDVGGTAEFPCFIVSKYIEGVSMAERIKVNRPLPGETAKLVAMIAEALHYAHRKRLVHRDVKPGNILIDTSGTPFLVDFGLASKEESIGKGLRYAGTPAYMSPEQARGEGHRVDGRSDIFSLGVVFYELLTGSRPFHGNSQDELLEQVRSFEPRPPRQHDDGISKELERICLKALSKRASERYSTAKDMAEDLRVFVNATAGVAMSRELSSAGKLDTGALSRQMGMGDSQRATVSRSTFFFADFKGFTERVRILEKTAGHQAAAEMKRKVVQYVDDVFQTLHPALPPADYSLIDTAGDGFFFHFRNAADTFRFVQALHKATSEHNAKSTEEITEHWFRAGASTGDAAWEGGKPIGHVVNVGSRLLTASTGGDLVIDQDTYDALTADVKKQFGPREVISDKHDRVYEVYRCTFGRSLPRLATPVSVVSAPSSTNSGPARIVPKGLRSFDAHDADFFLELLPGPRDREGLPDSLRFWKTRIEETDADSTFPIGLIYGPSGCGKSSLVKAGLLPRLSNNVITIYVEATGGETEARLLNGLRKRCPALATNLNLKDSLAALRRGHAVPAGKKVLIVLDQFEQWLHAMKEKPNSELVQALRQCDGSRVQCVVMVRDDFWLAISRFLRELEIPLIEGQNSALADLFDTDHAGKVLAAFGRAFGRLPETPGQTNDDAKQFLTQAVSGLAQEGKVIPVRLALFAEMMKGKPWTAASLKEVGGTEGVGVTFLEETFSAATAPPEHRYHQKAARAVLKALLPQSGADIKGHMRAETELRIASGYANRPRDFDDLIRILDGEIRLLTPTDPEGKETSDDSTTPACTELPEGVEPRNRYYQLTHDYLVPALRDWLTRKQRETRRGRAELLLADRAGVWNSRPENRQLPSLGKSLSIRLLTRQKTWTPPQRKMMERASRYHALRGAALALVFSVTLATGMTARRRIVEQQQATQAAGLVKRLIDAETDQVPAIVAEMAGFRRWANPLLRQENRIATATSRQKLHTSLALLPVDAGQVDFLYGGLLTADTEEIPVIVAALLPHKDVLLDRLWCVALAGKSQEPGRLRAASALARYDLEDARWIAASPQVVNDLVRENPVYMGQWSELFRPVKNRLLPDLAVIFRERQAERSTERNLATSLLSDYAADQPQVLADILMDADEKQFPVVYPRFKAQGERALPIVIGEIERRLPPEAPDDSKERLAKRQANAAMAFLEMNRSANIWPLLKHGPDPRARSYLIHRFSALGADPNALIDRLKEEPDLSIRRALILSLGEFGERDFLPAQRALLTTRLQDLYRTAADPGLHSAAEWLLRSWKQESSLGEMNEQWARDNAENDSLRIQKLKGIANAATRQSSDTAPHWYVNGQGQTMVVIPGPVEFEMGSPPTETNREDDERQHRRRIGRTFALAAKPVTLEQYWRFEQDYKLPMQYSKPTLPVVATSWYQAAAYCNWLSKEEGIAPDQWCYEMDNGEVSKLKKNYLALTGYRLPTEAEMEYATRAGATTSRCYGEAEDLLAKNAWYAQNSQDTPWPVGTRQPNDLGFFDLHGNVWCWCQEQYKPYPIANDGEAVEDKEDDLNIISTDSRVLRGGSYYSQASSVRSACRGFFVPTTRKFYFVGFRPARTLPLDPLATLPSPAKE